jgi:two-component system sensor histidine kinase LytS
MLPLSFSEGLRPVMQLLLSLLEHFGLIVAAAFLLLSSSALRRMLARNLSVRDKVALSLFFGFFGILGTYAGDPIQGAIANLRAISVITAGLFGGPAVGIGAGLLAGGHRFLIDIGGFTSTPCALATLLEGAAAGLVSLHLSQGVLNWRVAVIIGLLGESMHMGMVLAMARPFDAALTVVKVIAVPMILLNSVGAAFLVEVIRAVVSDRERRASLQARKALTIANRTVSHLRAGLSSASATATAQIIFEHTRVAAVAITDTHKLMAYVGLGADQNPVGQKVRTRATGNVLASGTAVFLKDSQAGEMDFPCAGIESSIIVALKKAGRVIGSLKFFGDRRHVLTPIDFEIAMGLADLFSTQLELEDIQIKAQLLARAEIKRLQSQINPHFLFNALNTIASFCRTNSTRARQLLLELSNYLRRNIQDHREFVSFSEELDQIRSYLAIEHARFGDRITFDLKIAPGVEKWPVPPLIVQPLVENAVKHGLSAKEEGGTVKIRAERRNGTLRICVQDNGVGINGRLLDRVLAAGVAEGGSTGLGLKNVHQRLVHIYGPQGQLTVNSRPDRGTAITLDIPIVQPACFSEAYE